MAACQEERAGGLMPAMEAANMTAPGMFAQLATAYSAKWRIPMDKIKEAITHVSVKSHAAGALNPKAHLRSIITEEKSKRHR